MAAKRGPKSMTDEHKEALEHGRAEGRIVRAYLEALRGSKPKRGRRRTSESIGARLATIDEQLKTASAIDELKLIQERRDLNDELANIQSNVDLSELEASFIKVAKSYADRKGISYASWREVGVSAATLTSAGIKRGN